MKRLFLIFALLTAIVVGCKKDEAVEETVPRKEISLSVADAVSYTTSASLNLSASGVYLSEYNSWGVLVSKKIDKDRKSVV